MITQRIDLDCEPGDPRPGDLIGDLISGTGLPLRESTSRFFGCWIWYYEDIDKDVWETERPILFKRIKDLHSHGLIRYGRC